MYIEINDISEIRLAARRFLSEMGNNKIFAFTVKWERGKLPSLKLFAKKWACAK